jgi:hypothetical protein
VYSELKWLYYIITIIRPTASGLLDEISGSYSDEYEDGCPVTPDDGDSRLF